MAGGIRPVIDTVGTTTPTTRCSTACAGRSSFTPTRVILHLPPATAWTCRRALVMPQPSATRVSVASKLPVSSKRLPDGDRTERRSTARRDSEPDPRNSGDGSGMLGRWPVFPAKLLAGGCAARHDVGIFGLGVYRRDRWGTISGPGVTRRAQTPACWS